jgi:hypothetical protein
MSKTYTKKSFNPPTKAATVNEKPKKLKTQPDVDPEALSQSTKRGKSSRSISSFDDCPFRIVVEVAFHGNKRGGMNEIILCNHFRSPGNRRKRH